MDYLEKASYNLSVTPFDHHLFLYNVLTAFESILCDSKSYIQASADFTVPVAETPLNVMYNQLQRLTSILANFQTLRLPFDGNRHTLTSLFCKNVFLMVEHALKSTEYWIFHHINGTMRTCELFGFLALEEEAMKGWTMTRMQRILTIDRTVCLELGLCYVCDKTRLQPEPVSRSPCWIVVPEDLIQFDWQQEVCEQLRWLSMLTVYFEAFVYDCLVDAVSELPGYSDYRPRSRSVILNEVQRKERDWRIVYSNTDDHRPRV